MKERMIPEISDEDKRLIEILKRLNYPGPVSKVLVFLLKKQESTSREIELYMDMRQPEVSVAVLYLKERKIIRVEEVPKPNGRGRPTHRYFLNKQPIDIVKRIEKEGLEQIEKTQADLNNLKKLTKSILEGQNV